MLKLGLITDASGDQYRIWYTHGASHYIGIDVHDVGDRMRPPEPGMAFTIEPGIYIRQSALDTLPRTPQNIAFIEIASFQYRNTQGLEITVINREEVSRRLIALSHRPAFGLKRNALPAKPENERNRSVNDPRQFRVKAYPINVELVRPWSRRRTSPRS